MKLSDLLKEDTTTGDINVGGKAPNPPLGTPQRRYRGDVLSKHTPKSPAYQTAEELKASLKGMISDSALEFMALYPNKTNKKGE